MLTVDQMSDLRKIRDKIEDKRLLLLVNEAIKGWSRDNVHPGSEYYGVNYESDGEFYEPNDDGCCLLGAACIGKQKIEFSTNVWEWEKMEKILSLTNDEHDAIVCGFDGIIYEGVHEDWYKIAWDIGEVLECH